VESGEALKSGSKDRNRNPKAGLGTNQGTKMSVKQMSRWGACKSKQPAEGEEKKQSTPPRPPGQQGSFWTGSGSLWHTYCSAGVMRTEFTWDLQMGAGEGWALWGVQGRCRTDLTLVWALF
jgi:hypothetical protein